MQSGWWWLQDPEELEAVIQALHLRGIREKALHKHLTKHKEYLREVCARAANGKHSSACELEGLSQPNACATTCLFFLTESLCPWLPT